MSLCGLRVSSSSLSPFERLERVGGDLRRRLAHVGDLVLALVLTLICVGAPIRRPPLRVITSTDHGPAFGNFTGAA